MAHYLFMLFAVSFSPLANHLWQSTACLAMAGLLTLLMRREQARVRYGIWLAASIKFLVPMSLLIMLGARLAPPRVQAHAARADTLYFDIRQASQPFTPVPKARVSEQRRPAQPNGLWWWTAPILPPAMVVIWMGGFLFVLARWGERWWRVSKDVRAARPLQEGRELEVLHRISRLAGVANPIEIRVSQASLEPGIFGIFRPVLVWPEEISGRLDDAELESILAHEICHVRRRDNLAAALHMLVEAAFWFYPPVWWLGARMINERERACDEAVVGLGSEPRVYAEGILKACEFCVESPWACVSGVTGADLKDRIVDIMTKRLTRDLSLGRKVFLTLACAAVAFGPMLYGLLSAPIIRAQSAPGASGPLPSFEVASIKLDRSGALGSHVHYRLGRYSATGVAVEKLIQDAYGLQGFQVSGAPGWLHSEKYDIEAKDYDSVVENLPKLPPEERREHYELLLQSLLADRFNLKVRHETRELPLYALVVAKNGPRMKVATPGDTYPNGYKGPDGKSHPGFDSEARGEVTAQAVRMGQFARYLTDQVGRTVVNQTGLKDNFDFTLRWSPEENRAAMSEGARSEAVPINDSFGPSIFTALQEQLGLKLESTKGPVEVLVIEHIERPTEN